MALKTITIVLDDSPSRAFFHRDTDADRGVVDQMFQRQDYKISGLRRVAELRAIYRDMVRRGAVPLIVDAGANIGASVVFFSFTYPKARIVALEPAHDNFDLLLKNIDGLDAVAHCAAIGATAGTTHLFDPGEGEWGYRTSRDRPGVTVPVLAMDDIVEPLAGSGCEPFIAKIDIEGGEAELFSSALDWIDRFPLLIVELHDWLLCGSANSRNFLRCMADRDRDFVYLGENVFSIRNPPTRLP